MSQQYYQQGYNQPCENQQNYNYNAQYNQQQSNYNYQNQYTNNQTKPASNIEIKYPYEVEKSGRNGVYFSIHPKMYIRGEEEMPMMLVNNYSTINLNISYSMNNNQTQNNQNQRQISSCDANISLRDFPSVYEKSKYYYRKYLDNNFNGLGKNINMEEKKYPDLLYTEMTIGKYKGKKLYECINKNWEKEIKDHCDFLYKNFDKYPKNRNDYNVFVQLFLAIKEKRIVITDELINGNINNISNDNLAIIETIKVPNAKKKDNLGYTEVVNLKITTDLKNVNIDISKYKALTNKDTMIQSGSKKDEYGGYYKCSIEEWWNMIDNTHSRIKQIEQIFCKEQLKIANKYSWKPQN